MNWPKDLKIKSNYPLKGKTTFRIGGKALFFSEPKDTAELQGLLKAAKANKLRIFILGAGSNLLVGDKGAKGLVIKLNSSPFKQLLYKGNSIEAGSALMLGELIKFSFQQSLQGLEFLVGIPGTLGGAIAMNAGCWGRSIGDLVKEIKVMDNNGRMKELKGKDLKFGYRTSNLSKYIILSATLRIEKGNQPEIKKNINEYLSRKRANQDLTKPNAGCIFRNPSGDSAGKLIDLCGLKGRKIGDAAVSERHANFILNNGDASAKDVLALMQLITKLVKNKFKINLQPEIKIWD